MQHGNYKKYIDKAFSVFDKYPREYFILGFFILFSLFIIFKVLSYTVLNYDFYKKLADKQQLGEVILPVTRGTIYSNTDGQTTLGTSLSLNDLAIDPMVDGDKARLAVFLRDIVYKQICHLKSAKECYNNMLKFNGVLEIKDFKLDEEYIKSLIFTKVQERISKINVTNVVLSETVDPKDIDLVKSFRFQGIYVNGTNIYANPEEINDPKTIASKLNTILKYDDVNDLEKALTKRKIRYIPIISKLSISLSDEVEKFIKEEKDALKKGILDKSNSIGNFIILTGNPSRYYPEKEVASSVIGFLDNDGVGHYGIEGYFNDQLKGNNGKVITRKDIKGRSIEPLTSDKNDLVTAGADITLTIDRNIQKKVESVIEEGVKRFNANKGTIIVMDPKTGDIMAMANYPNYDLNNPADVYELEKVNFINAPNPGIDLLGKVVLVEDNQSGEEFFYDGKKIKLRLATREELSDTALVKYKYKNDFGAGVYQNDAISSLYEPGSIMKAMTVAIGLDSGEIKRYDLYQDNMELTIDNFTIKNIGKQCAGYKSFNNALIFSCNVGMIRIVQRIGRALLYNYLQDFGFGKPTDISLEGEIYSTLPNYEKWSKSRMYTMSYGLGISVTPLQMATAYSILANGGLYVKPNIIKSIKMPSGKVVTFKPEITHRVIKESTSKIITSMLVDSIDNGFAKNGKVEGYNMAGKTGTAQIAYKGGYEDGQGSTTGSFAGYGPAEDPRFVIISKIDRPRTTAFGGESSAYMFADISKFLLDYYGIPSKIKK